MALLDSSLRLSLLFCRTRKVSGPAFVCSRRDVTSTAAPLNPLEDLETDSSFSNSPIPDQSVAASFDPVAKSKARPKQLPRSRYQYRSPKYLRGPLHPHQPPPDWDPSSRLFAPGPFSLPRAEQTYESTIAPDILTLCYVHHPPGFKPPQTPPRLRPWDDSSPYHKNRPLRGPRGGDVLRLLRKPITFQNIPKLEKITVNSYVKDVLRSGSGALHVAGMAIQSITNVRVKTHKSKTNVPSWGLIRDKSYVACTAELTGEDMYHFFGKLVDIVLPRIKDWPGIKGSSGDSSGNITFGLEPKMVGLFPEIEVNYDMYPPEKIPGANIILHTTARTDKDARLLINSLGVPFHGKYVN